MRPESRSFMGKDEPVDNLLGTRTFKIPSGVPVNTSRVSNSGTACVNSRRVHIGVTPCRDCVSFEGTGKEAACKRGPRNDAHTKVVQRGEHLALFLTIYKRVVILHRNKRREIVHNRVIYSFTLQ